MPFERVTFRPGINRQYTPTLNEGGWSDGNLVRFKDGLPQPIGGWVPLLATQFFGVCRRIHQWVNLAGQALVGLGTSQKLYVVSGDTLNDVTPIRTTQALTNPFYTTAGSTQVQVNAVLHGAVVGDTVIIPSTTVAGLTLLGPYVVTGVFDTGNFYIAAAAPATSTVAGGGGSVTLTYLLNIGAADVGFASGWGAGSWGNGTWGTARTSNVATNAIRIWSLDHWGEELLASPRDGAIYDWKPALGVGTRAAVLPAAPLYSKCILVGMPERHLIAFGAEYLGVYDPMLIRWCDVENYGSWVASATNSAGSIRAVGGSTIMSAVAGPQEMLVWTDTHLHAFRFQGLPYVYGIFVQGSGCGLASPGGAIVLNGVAYWIGLRSFYRYAGQVQALPCTVWDDVFLNLNWQQRFKIVAGANAGFNEISWHYPSAGSVENDSYVSLNVVDGTWSKGALARTAWDDANMSGRPVATGPDATVYSHEFGADANGKPLPAWIESGMADMQNGDTFSMVDQVMPDFRDQSGAAQITLKAQDYPNGAVKQKGPYPLQPNDNYISARIRGRQIAVRLASSGIGCFWRLGAMRLRVSRDGGK